MWRKRNNGFTNNAFIERRQCGSGDCKPCQIGLLLAGGCAAQARDEQQREQRTIDVEELLDLVSNVLSFIFVYIVLILFGFA